MTFLLQCQFHFLPTVWCNLLERPPGRGFSFWGGFCFPSRPPYQPRINSDFIFLHDSVFAGFMFVGTFPVHLGYPVCGVQLFTVFSYHPLSL